MRVSGRLLAIFAVLALLLGACSPGSKEEATDTADSEAAGAEGCATEGLTTVKVATLGIYTDAALTWAEERCYFADAGIAIEVVVVPNPPATIAALTGGEVDVAYAPSIPVVRAFVAGAPVLALAAADGYDQASIDKYGALLDDTGIFMAEAIESAKDLEGRTVAVPARGAQLEVTTAYAVLQAGGDPAKVNFVALDLANMIDAVKAGEIDAAALVSPFTLAAAEAGLVDAGITAVDFFGPGAVGIWTTSGPAMEEKGDLLRAFRNAVHQSNAEATANPSEFWEVASRVTGVDLATFEANDISYVFPTEVTTADFDKVADKLLALGFLEAKPDLSTIVVE
jgi:NitT/TauT family transport system substrate-binding protein